MRADLMDLDRVAWTKSRPQWSKLCREDGGDTSSGFFIVGTVSANGTNLDSVAGWVPTWTSPLHGQKNTIVLDTTSIPGLDEMHRNAVKRIQEAEQLYVSNWTKARGKARGTGARDSDIFDVQSVYRTPSGDDHRCLHFRHRIFERVRIANFRGSLVSLMSFFQVNKSTHFARQRQLDRDDMPAWAPKLHGRSGG